MECFSAVKIKLNVEKTNTKISQLMSYMYLWYSCNHIILKSQSIRPWEMSQIQDGQYDRTILDSRPPLASELDNTNVDFVARSRYLRQGYVIASHCILWDAITYPYIKYLLLATKSSNKVSCNGCVYFVLFGMVNSSLKLILNFSNPTWPPSTILDSS